MLQLAAEVIGLRVSHMMYLTGLAKLLRLHSNISVLYIFLCQGIDLLLIISHKVFL